MTADRLGTIAAEMRVMAEHVYASSPAHKETRLRDWAALIDAIAALTPAAGDVSWPQRIDTDTPALALSRFVDGYLRGRGVATVAARDLFGALCAYVIGHPALAAPVPPPADAVRTLVGVDSALPPLPRCWTGSPVTVTWAEDGERTTREVYTADQMHAYARAHEAALSAAPASGPRPCKNPPTPCGSGGHPDNPEPYRDDAAAPTPEGGNDDR